MTLAACGGSDSAAPAPAPTPAPTDETPAEVDELAAARAFYAGEQVNFVVSFGEGGGYDIIARAMAPYLETELGASVFVDNRPGAGGLVAANSLFVANSSGLEFGFFSGQGIAGAVVGEAAGATFNLGEFSFLARAAEDPRVFTVGAPSGFLTFADVLAAPRFRFGSSGPGGSDHIDANVLLRAIDGFDGEIITGYSGSAETELAATAGQTDGAAGTYGSRLGAIRNGDHVAILAIASERISDIPEVPTILEIPGFSAEGRALLEAHLAFQAMGRMLLAPPGVPADRLEFLRLAFRNVLTNPAFIAEMDAIGQPITYLSGPEMELVAADVLNAPAVYVDLMKEAYGSK
jgi:tripartite-type tricarboxylate transporter receptor subunit TctC